MVDRIFRTIVQHSMQLLVLILLPIAIGGAVAYLLPRQYRATATLWALHRYDTLTATGVDSSNLSTPAETQVSVLSELLLARSFSLAVAAEAHLAETLQPQVLDNPQTRDDALLRDITDHVQVQTQGYDLFVITYTGTNPQIAQQVVAAIIDNYGQQIRRTVAPEEQNLLGNLQAEFSQAQQDVQSALTVELQYSQSHPKLTPADLQGDQQYRQLQAQLQQAQLHLQYIQSSIDSLELNAATHRMIATNLYEVIDTPTVPSKPVSRLKTLLLGVGAGLGVAIVASMLFIALLVRRDRKVYRRSDLHKVTSYPVVMELPRLSPKTVSKIVKASRQSGSLVSNGRG